MFNVVEPVLKRLPVDAVVESVPPETATLPEVVMFPFDPVMEKLVAMTSLAHKERALTIAASERSSALVIAPPPEEVTLVSYQAEDGIRDYKVTGVQTCALPICAALQDAGVRATPAWEIPGDFTETSGFAACLKLLAERSPLRPTAIFAANDAMAIGALSALREAHVQVPGDMAVAGFDDIPMARYMHPPLSTVRVNISALGERATRRLLDAVANGRQHQKRS